MSNPEPKEPSRQERRYEARTKELNRLRVQYGGATARGGFHWPEGMTRRIARKIARDVAKKAVAA